MKNITIFTALASIFVGCIVNDATGSVWGGIATAIILFLVIVIPYKLWVTYKEKKYMAEIKQEMLNDLPDFVETKSVENVATILYRLKNQHNCIGVEVGDYSEDEANFWKEHGFNVEKYDRNSDNELMSGAESRFGLVLSR